MGQEPESTPQEGQAPAPASTEPKGEATKTPSESGESPPNFSAEYVKQLRAEAAQHRTRAQEAESKLSEREEAEKSDLEKAQGKATKLEQAKAEAEAKLLRFEIAAEKKVPPEALDLLVGNTREELEAKADKLLSLVKKPEETPDFDGGAREPAADPDTPEKAHNKILLGLFGAPPSST